MQVGAENRNKLIAAVALMVVAAFLVVRWLFPSDGTPAESAAPATSTGIAPLESPRPASTAVRKGGRKTISAALSLDPTLRYDLLRASEDTQYKGSGRNIFQAQVDIPKPVAPVQIAPPAPPPPPPGPPPPPPIDLKFFGFASRPGEPKRVFLSQGEDVFIAGEGDIVDRRYKVRRISAASVEVEDVLNNNRQEIFLTQN
jgi:hypothetical protein